MFAQPTHSHRSRRALMIAAALAGMLTLMMPVGPGHVATAAVAIHQPA